MRLQKSADILAAITELNEAIDIFRTFNTQLHKESNGYWTEDIGKLSHMIGKLVEARERLYQKHREFTMSTELCSELLANAIVTHHEFRKNWLD